MARPPRAARAARTARAPIVWDIVTSSVLLAVGVVIAAVLTFFAFFLVFASDSCGSGGTACDTGRMGAGFLVALLGPAIVTLAAIVVAIVLMVRRRVSFWVSIAGIVLAVLVWLAGAGLVASGVPGFTF